MEEIVGGGAGPVGEGDAAATAASQRARPGFAQRDVAVGDHGLGVAEALGQGTARLAAHPALALGGDAGHHGRDHHRTRQGAEAVLVADHCRAYLLPSRAISGTALPRGRSRVTAPRGLGQSRAPARRSPIVTRSLRPAVIELDGAAGLPHPCAGSTRRRRAITPWPDRRPLSPCSRWLSPAGQAAARPLSGRSSSSRKGAHGASVITANGVEFLDRAEIPRPVVRRGVDEAWRPATGFLMPSDGVWRKTATPDRGQGHGLAVVLRSAARPRPLVGRRDPPPHGRHRARRRLPAGRGVAAAGGAPRHRHRRRRARHGGPRQHRARQPRRHRSRRHHRRHARAPVRTLLPSTTPSSMPRSSGCWLTDRPAPSRSAPAIWPAR